MQAETLTAEFGIAGILDFVETEHGLVKGMISLDDMAGELYLQGAHLTEWQPPGGRPVLFTSPNSGFAPGRAIRGGIPIIFPWFGPSRHASAAPQHGFARTAPWHLDGVETAGRESLTLTFSLSDKRCRLAVLAGAVSRDLHRGPGADLVIAPRRAKPCCASDHLRGGVARLFCDF